MAFTTKPQPEEFPAFYHRYVEQAEGRDMLEAMTIASVKLHTLLMDAPAELGDHRYAPGKWTVKDVLQHVIDGERIFGYRALRFARGDQQELPGYDEDAYAPAAHAERRTLAELLREHDVVREASLLLFRSFSPEMLQRGGIANGRPNTVRAIGWTIPGHAEHHTRILAERYLLKTLP
jgi:hypothetical protein